MYIVLFFMAIAVGSILAENFDITDPFGMFSRPMHTPQLGEMLNRVVPGFTDRTLAELAANQKLAVVPYFEAVMKLPTFWLFFSIALIMWILVKLFSLRNELMAVATDSEAFSQRERVDKAREKLRASTDDGMATLMSAPSGARDRISNAGARRSFR